MPITLVTATPGSGKTLWMIQEIFKLLRDGRMVYSNIDGINISGVLPAPEDWRDLPNKSVVIYDEAQEHPAFDKDATITDRSKVSYYKDIADGLQIHRHFGFDIYLITQHPTLLKGSVLGYVSRHIWLKRIFGTKKVSVFQFGEAQTNFSKTVRSQAENKYTWTFPTHLYKFYKSASDHTIKSYFPMKYWVVAALILIFLPYLSYDKFNNVLERKQEQKQSIDAVTTDQNSSSTVDTKQSSVDQIQLDMQHELARPALIVATDTYCYAKNAYGELLDITTAQCLQLSEMPQLMSGSRLQQQSSTSSMSSDTTHQVTGSTAPIIPTTSPSHQPSSFASQL